MTQQLVSVALCTFNGQEYITEQLLSIVNQTIQPMEIVVCDDNSQDDTITCIEKFRQTSPVPIIVVRNETSLGVIKNFEKAIRHCSGDYVALSDQDDIWFANKIEVTLAEIQKVETACGASTPLLAHTDLCVVNSHCQLIHPSFMRLQHIAHIEKDPIKTLVIQNFVTGCTVIMNKALINIALPIPSNAVVHDWWLALVVASCGKLLYISQPTVFYRQHGANTIGAKQYISLGTVKRLLDITALNKSIAATIVQASLLKSQLHTIMTEKSFAIIAQYLESISKMGIVAALHVLRQGISKQGLLRNVIFLLLIMNESYKKFLPQELKN